MRGARLTAALTLGAARTLGAALMLGAALPCALAAPLNIANAPLFLGTGVEPNLILAVDDSARMDFELALPTNGGAAWWLAAPSGACAPSGGGSFAGCGSDGTTDQPVGGQLNVNSLGLPGASWKLYGYLFPNGCDATADSDQRRSCDGTDGVYALPPLPADAWARDPEYNAAYFNPAASYAPWPSGGGLTFTDAPPSATRYDPVYGPSSTLDLTQDLAGNAAVSPSAACGDATFPGTVAGWSFHVYAGMVLPAGTCYRGPADPSWTQLTADTTIGAAGAPASDQPLEIRYFPATFYLKATTPLPASFGFTGPTLAGQAPDGTSLLGYEIKPANFASPAQYSAALQNFADWFTYYRKRHEQMRAGLGGLFASLTGTRVAGFAINQGSPNLTMRDLNQPATRSALLDRIYQRWTGNGATPNRAAVANIVRNLRRTDAAAPVTASCQVNLGLLASAGYSDPLESGDGFDSVGNVDGTAGLPYVDAVANTLADGVMSAYLNPLRSDLPAGMVAIPGSCGTPGADPRLDCNRNLHLKFYGGTLGAAGYAYNPVSPADPYASTVAWPSALALAPTGSPAAVDDLWHATVDGRGALLNVNPPAALASALSSALSGATPRVSAAGAVALSSGAVNAHTLAFETRFDSSQWSGDVEAFALDGSGALLPTAQWSAAAAMPAAGNRQIFTVGSSGTPEIFRWASLDAARQAALIGSDTATVGAQRLDYLRGDSSLEQRNGGTFRNRSSELGDIVDSAPAYVGAPAFRYPDSLESAPYSAFAAAQASRVPALYVGANDGMLHAFRADTGQELFAYLPGAVFANLAQLSDPAYSHHYFVDGSPTTGDAFYGGSWHTVLASGLNAGGQGVFALDITQPDAYRESSGASPLLWEFTDAQDADLGDTFSRPSIVRMHNGRWAAVFGNGYNNTAPDGHASTTGDAVLYVVDLASGALLAKIDTGVGMAQDPTGGGRPNGLATAALVDVDGDGNVDYGYAGDLFGNLWKFDFTDADPANWKVAYGAGSAPAPLFVARDASGGAQPITTKPAVSRGPAGQGLIVLFGTGKYLEPGDTLLANLSTQSLYGIIDNMTGTDADQVSGRPVLTQQQITRETTLSGGAAPVSVRVTTANLLGSNRGWYLDLISPAGFQGEMLISDPQLSDGQVIFTTFIPSSDPCSAGGRSWLMTLDLFDGAHLDHTPYDLNGDGRFNSADYVGSGSGAVPASGIATTVGLTARPALLAANSSGACDYLIMAGSTGASETVCRNPGARGFGRQSWRQVR